MGPQRKKIRGGAIPGLLIFRAVSRKPFCRETGAGSHKLVDQEVIAIESIAKISVEEISRKAGAFCCLVHLKMNITGLAADLSLSC